MLCSQSTVTVKEEKKNRRTAKKKINILSMWSWKVVTCVVSIAQRLQVNQQTGNVTKTGNVLNVVRISTTT